MAEQPSYPGPGMPRWVKVSAIVVAVLALLVVIVVLVSGGEHGPRRHLPGGETPGVQTPGGHTPPLEHGP
jgi:hypothetical protein